MKNFLMLGLLVFFQSFALATPNAPFIMPKIVFAETIECDLDPPVSLSIDLVGSDWVKVSWPAMIGVPNFRLQAFGGNGDPLATPILVPGSATEATVSTAGNDGQAYVRIWSVCETGEYNDDNYTESETVDTVILDLVVNGFIWPNQYTYSTPVGVSYENGQNISWNGTETPFVVTYTPNPPLAPASRRFSVAVSQNGGEVIVQINHGANGNNNERLVFDEHDYNSFGYPSDFVLRFRNDPATKISDATIVGEFSAGHSNTSPESPGKLFKEAAWSPNCVMKRVISLDPPKVKAPSPEINLTDRYLFANNSDQFTAKPNPFRDDIQVKLPESKTQAGTTIHLYDLLGSFQRNFTLPADQTELTFNTTDLKPGVYFLRVETDGIAETIKLVKAQ